MYVLVIDPARTGHLDVLLPIVIQLKKYNPDIYLQLVYIDTDQYHELQKNKFLNEIVNMVGEAVLLKSFGKKGSILRKFILIAQLIRYSFRMLISKHVIFLHWKSLDNLVIKFIASIASFKGKTLTYQAMNNHYLEEMRRYFDEYGQPRSTRARELRDRQFSKRNKYTEDRILLKSGNINTGDSALINSVDSLNYLAMMGYSKFSIIGYTHLYPEYLKYANEKCYKYLLEEIPLNDLRSRTFFGIFANKYWGLWAGRDDNWFINKFCEVVECLKETTVEPIILVRAHPTLKSDIIEQAIKKSGYSNIYITNLHPTHIGMVSEAVIGLAESTAYHYVMGAGSPYIDYGGMRLENYEIFPEGSLFASYGTIVALNKEELFKTLLDTDMLKMAVLNYKPSLKHKMDLSIFKQ